MKLHYKDFAHLIDVDAFEAAISFEVLQQSGDEDRGHCLDFFSMHNSGDSTGKLYINREKRVYNCWVCGGGSLLDLAMHSQNMGVDEAIEWIHQFAAPEQKSEDYLNDIDAIFERAKPQTHVLPYFNQLAVAKFPREHPWFAERGISQETVEKFRLGYDEAAVRRAPRKEGKPTEEDFVGPAIVLPHFWDGQLVGWQHRWLDAKEDRPKWVAKYTNTPDFPREHTLFNYHGARKAVEQMKMDLPPGYTLQPILCESLSTVLYLESLGYAAIATFGSSVSESQLKLLRGFRGGLYVAVDNDPAGDKFRKLTVNYLEDYMPVKVILPPENSGEGADLGDLTHQEIEQALAGAHYSHMEP